MEPNQDPGTPGVSSVNGRALPKAPTGIFGLDDVTAGGLPRGRTTLICGGPGCGKSMMATEFLVRGAAEFGEPGVLMLFEETGEEMAQNVASLGLDLDDLVERGLLAVDHVRVERSEIEETGEFDLEGLFIRLAFAIESVGARRVVLDTIEALFAGLTNERILRAEMRRLFRWLNDRGITAIVTGERGEGPLTRHGLEEYVSDCVILLDHRVSGQVSTRRLRVVKYRGSGHGTNEYPFLINDTGITVLPITSLGLRHEAPTETVSTGVPGLDAMLEGKGFYRGSSVLLSGTAGMGKTSLAAHFAEATCRRGERCLYVAFEESPQQLFRNMRSIGIDLERWHDEGLLKVHATRPTLQGLEMHLVGLYRMIEEFEPAAVVVDPISNLMAAGELSEVEATLMRLIDHLKARQITAVLTSLTQGGSSIEATDVGISSLMDTWILVRMIEADGERNRVLYVLKARGMAHSHQVREMVVSREGVDLVEVYLGTDGVLTGAARQAQESRERSAELARKQELDRKRREIERKRRVVEAQVAALRAQLEAEELEIAEDIRQDEAREALYELSRQTMAAVRADPTDRAHPTNRGQKNEG